MRSNTGVISSVKLTERIQALDIMRGIVLLGILLMNINGFGLTNAYDNPTVSGGATGLDLYTWFGTTLLFEGSMRGLFSLLFGVGMYILLKRSQDREAGIAGADIYFRRLLWLLFFGLVHGYLLLWKGEILYDYALMGLLVYSFRNMSPKKLILVAAFLVAVGTFWNYMDHRSNITILKSVASAETQKAAGLTLTAEQEDATTRWQGIQKKKSQAYVNEYNGRMRSDYFTIVKHLAPINMESDTLWFYKYDAWDILSMMLLGIALFKLNILTAKRSFRLYGSMAAAGYVVGLSINYYEIQTIMGGNFSFLAFSKAEVTYYLGRLGISIGHIGAVMLLVKAPVLMWLKRRLASVGQMALSNYIIHSIICMVVFTGVGFGMFGKLQRHELLYVVFAIWVFQLIVSPIWLRYFEFGPLEWLWRRLSYLQKPAFRKKPTSEKAIEVAVAPELTV